MWASLRPSTGLKKPLIQSVLFWFGRRGSFQVEVLHHLKDNTQQLLICMTRFIDLAAMGVRGLHLAGRPILKL